MKAAWQAKVCVTYSSCLVSEEEKAVRARVEAESRHGTPEPIQQARVCMKAEFNQTSRNSTSSDQHEVSDGSEGETLDRLSEELASLARACKQSVCIQLDMLELNLIPSDEQEGMRVRKRGVCTEGKSQHGRRETTLNPSLCAGQ